MTALTRGAAVLSVSDRRNAGTVASMGILIAALVIIIAIAIAFAIAEFLIGLVIVVAGIIGAIYIWRYFAGDRGRAVSS